MRIAGPYQVLPRFQLKLVQSAGYALRFKHPRRAENRYKIQ
jgi:hypothetical protein